MPNISNAASASITGVEVEAAASAWRGVQLAGSVSWLDATYDRYLAVGMGGLRGDAAGHRLNNAPEWSGSGSAAYEFATGRAGFTSVRCDVSGQSRVFFTPFNTAIETQAPYALVHLRAGFEPHHRRWELSVFVRNLANQEVLHLHEQHPAACVHGAARRTANVGDAVHARPGFRSPLR